MTGETPGSSEDSLTFDRSNMELQTDDQKVFATTAKDQVTSSLSSDFYSPTGPLNCMSEVVISQTCTMPTQHNKELSAQKQDDAPPLVSTIHFDSMNDTDITKCIGEAGVADGQLTLTDESFVTTHGSTSQSVLPGGLSLSRGLDFTEDFPMIDDEDIEEVDGDADPIPSDPNPTTDSVKVPILNGSDDSPKADFVTSAQNKENASVQDAVEQCQSSQPTSLKSALKTSRSRSKKGLRVSFHDTKVFYIDTEAEATAEPQLLTVRSLDLPSASTDYRVVSVSYLPGMSRDGLLNGDAEETCAFQCYDAPDENSTGVERKIEELETPDDHQKAKNNEDVELNLTKADADVAFNSTEPASVDTQQDEGMVEAVVTVERIEKAVETPNLAILEPIQSLTEANVRQHEILMERDGNEMMDGGDSGARDVSSTVLAKPEILETDLDAVVEASVGNSTTLPSASLQSANLVVSSKTSPGGKTLSPPLKELTVDVNSISNGNSTNSEWQVELSPLNSIPDSETDSSHSSQDTIIMMTSEESRRNDEHIRLSTLAHQRLGSKNGIDTASIGESSQDSDETLKYEEQTDQECRPAWVKSVDWENRLEMDRGQQQLLEGGSLSHRSSSAIRQLMERNAAKRSLLRYSSTKKKSPDDCPMEKQRQWRSHESLLDTIKQLTVDGDENSDEKKEWQRQANFPKMSDGVEVAKHWNNRNGFNSLPHMESRYLTNGTGAGSSDGSFTVREHSGANLSLQDIRGIDSSRIVEDSTQRRSQSVANVNVPGDVRQWKIDSQVRNEPRGGHIIQNGAQFSSVPQTLNGSLHRHSSSNDVLGRRDNLPHAQSLDRNMNHEHPVLEDDSDMGVDELAQFVQQDQARIERIRKRYSYSDGGDYEAISAFARRPSVRGIKPRFGSTNEILKQMQNQLQPNPLISPPNGRNTLSWPYPASVEMINGSVSTTASPPVLVPASPRNQVTGVSPGLQEDIYGMASPSKRSSYSSMVDGAKPTYVRLRRGREGTYVQLHGKAPGQPPPYQPPPPPPSHGHVSTMAPGQPQYRIHHHHHLQQQQHPSHQLHATTVQQYLPQALAPSHASPMRMHTKDERGAPEGASSSPKVAAFDSMYNNNNHHHNSLRYHPSAVANANGRTVTTTSDNSGVVYYVMQV